MKKYFLFLLLIGQTLQAGLSESPGFIPPAPKADMVPQAPPKAREMHPRRPEQQRQQTTTVGHLYTAPGIATLQGGQWVGSENLNNLTKDIGVVAEIIAPSTLSVPLTEEALRQKVVSLLQEARLNPHPAESMTKENPLPFLHLLIMVNPIERGFAAYCAGRLFEEVQIKRVFLKPNIVWQAITWEKQELILSPADQLQDSLNRTIQYIIKDFTDRLHSHQVTVK